MEGMKFTERGLTVEFEVDEILQDTTERTEKLLANPVFRERLERGEYQLILGIDSSGRVPTLLLQKIANSFHKTPLRFVSGGGNTRHDDTYSRQEQIGSIIYGIKQDLGESGESEHRVLLVDDVIGKGTSVADICSELQSRGISYDLVVLGATHGHTPDSLESLEDELNTEIFYPQFDTFPKIYGKKQMSGVQKSSGQGYAESYEEQDPAVLAYTRQRICEEAERLIKRMKKQE